MVRRMVTKMRKTLRRIWKRIEWMKKERGREEAMTFEGGEGLRSECDDDEFLVGVMMREIMERERAMLLLLLMVVLIVMRNNGIRESWIHDNVGHFLREDDTQRVQWSKFFSPEICPMFVRTDRRVTRRKIPISQYIVNLLSFDEKHLYYIIYDGNLARETFTSIKW